MTAPIVDLPGEHVAVPERMIVAPIVGVFRLLGVGRGHLPRGRRHRRRDRRSGDT